MNNEQFAKIFESEKHGQILIKKDINENDYIEIRIYFKPSGLGICSVALEFEEEDSKNPNLTFKNIDLYECELLIDSALENLDI